MRAAASSQMRRCKIANENLMGRQPETIACFSMEIALEAAMPADRGGLGMVAD